MTINTHEIQDRKVNFDSLQECIGQCRKFNPALTFNSEHLHLSNVQHSMQ